jgi:hypothetical protein
MADDLITKVICPIDTYDRILLEIESAIQELVPLAQQADSNGPQWHSLITALEYLRMAKKMSQEGDNYVLSVLDEEEFPEFRDEDDEEECSSLAEVTD